MGMYMRILESLIILFIVLVVVGLIFYKIGDCLRDYRESWYRAGEIALLSGCVIGISLFMLRIAYLCM